MKPTPDFEWPEYFKAAENSKLHRLFEHLDPHLHPGLTALDLGCGVGHGTVHLLHKGLQVTAVDIQKEALERLQPRIPEGTFPSLIQSGFLELSFEGEIFDIVVATNALYFLAPNDFKVFWPKLTKWIKPGGLFMGQFMGPNDGWSSREDYSHHTAEEARILLAGFDILHLHDDEREDVTCTGAPNHMHVVHVLARKLPAAADDVY